MDAWQQIDLYQREYLINKTAFLSVNPFETVPKEEVCRPVTTSMNAAPCNRNTFIITRARQNDGFGDSDVLHYGQDFCLRLESFGAITVPQYFSYLHN